MGTLIVRITDAQGFVHGMLLPAMNVPGLGHHLFSGGTAELKGINTVIAKESYLDVGQFKLPLRKDTECPTINYLDLELAPRGNYEKETAFPTRVISGHTIPTGSALASRLLRSGAVGAVAPLATAARPLIATSTAASGLPALQTTAYRVCPIRGGTIGATSTSTGTTSFAAPTITPGLATATTTATPAIPTPVMASAGSEHLPPAPGASERVHRRLLPRLLQDHGGRPAVQLEQHSKPRRSQRAGRAHGHGRGPVHVNGAALNHPPSKTIGGDTSYDRMFGKHVDLFFVWTVGARPYGDRQAHLAPTLRHNPISSSTTQSKKQLRAH